MAKKSTAFFCQSCGYESAKWLGQCPGCREWNTFVEEPVDKGSKIAKISYLSKQTAPVMLKDITGSESERVSSGIGELDRVLGGGIVRGSLVLIGGDPGIGPDARRCARPARCVGVRPAAAADAELRQSLIFSFPLVRVSLVRPTEIPSSAC